MGKFEVVEIIYIFVFTSLATCLGSWHQQNTKRIVPKQYVQFYTNTYAIQRARILVMYSLSDSTLFVYIYYFIKLNEI